VLLLPSTIQFKIIYGFVTGIWFVDEDDEKIGIAGLPDKGAMADGIDTTDILDVKVNLARMLDSQ
jgi:hypothetical protein